MKQSFIYTLTELMKKDESIITVTADMGFSVYENMQKEFPTRFINTGVTEQASISFATGLALTGYKVFFYAQAAFATMRCFEQVRLDVGYNFMNIKIIGVNAGFSLNQLGVSHFSQEDIGLMRLIPGMTIFSPANSVEMKWAINQAHKINGPVYIRYSKIESSPNYSQRKKIIVGEPINIKNGTNGIVIVSGGLLKIASEVVQDLDRKKIDLGLYSMPTIKPINEKKMISLLRGQKNVFVLEEHSIIGGFGSAISEIVAENRLLCRVTRIGIEDVFTSVTGSIPYLLDRNGLSRRKIALKISKLIK